jgi:hypothetical protein
MRSYIAALVAPLALAQVYPNRGNGNASLEGSFGSGYNVGNGFGHGDSHGTNMGHQTVQGAPEFKEGYAYTEDQATAHIYGYDSAPSLDNVTWADYTAGVDAYIATMVAQIALANADRVDYVDTVLNKKIDRLMEIHQDNILKLQAPFDLQLDLLDRELEDVAKAKGYASSGATDYFADLLERSEKFLNDRVEALDRESFLTQRTLTRATEEGKPVDDVLYAMRLDWLQGVHVSGTTATYDGTIYDMTHFDTEFDIFTYDMGHGKGHGHTSQGNRGQRRENTGFTVGVGNAGNDLSEFRGAPGPVDGKTRRYDKATLSGDGGNGRISNHELGIIQAKKDGAFGFDQGASLGVVQRTGRQPPHALKPKNRPSYEEVKLPMMVYDEPEEDYEEDYEESEFDVCSIAGLCADDGSPLYFEEAEEDYEEESYEEPEETYEEEYEEEYEQPAPKREYRPAPKPRPAPKKSYSAPPKGYKPAPKGYRPAPKSYRPAPKGYKAPPKRTYPAPAK